MEEKNRLADQFEANRPQLRAVAYRMLGSLSEAEDAVQETWLRLNRAQPGEIENLPAWLKTVVARVCLDALRSRKSRREELLGANVPATAAAPKEAIDPEAEAELADSVGLAMLVILQTLAPAERVAFVLHDMFGLSFDEIAPIVARTPEAARQLASRARRRVRGMPIDIHQTAEREVVDAYLAASRRGDLDGLLAILDPDVIIRSDAQALPPSAPRELRNARAVAALAVKHRARFARPILVNGEVGIVVAPYGKLAMILNLTIAQGKITEIDVIADPARLDGLELAALSD